VRFTLRLSEQAHNAVAASEKVFFQGEVLVPDCIPPHLIKIPNVDAFAKPLELRGRLPDSFLVSAEIGVRDPTTFSLAFPLHHTVAAGAGSSAPEPLISLREVHSARKGERKHETFVAPKMLGTSNVRKAQEERKLADLVDRDFVPVCELEATAASLAAPALPAVPLDSLSRRIPGPLDLATQTVAVASAPASTPSPLRLPVVSSAFPAPATGASWLCWLMVTVATTFAVCSATS